MNLIICFQMDEVIHLFWREKNFRKVGIPCDFYQ